VVGQIVFYGAVEHYLGAAAAALGRHDAAEEHLDSALERHRRMGALPFIALTQAELARVRRHRGDPDAGERFAEAHRAAETIGALGVARRAAELAQW
jgi:hypothetical protein